MDNKMNVKAGGATGSFSFPKLTMNFGGTAYTADCVYTGSDCNELRWSNGNVWKRVAGSEHVSTATIDGDTVTWPFWTGTATATVFGDKLYWSNGNVWHKTSSAPLQMKACNGKSNQKWSWEDGGEVKSKLDDMTCLVPSSTPGGITTTKCGTAGSFKLHLYGPAIQVLQV
jgi:hypothetical protein